MKDLVVCIDDSGPFMPNVPAVKKNEIYSVLFIRDYFGKKWYVLYEFGVDNGYDPSIFRPVDDTYGPAICETIEQEIELEKVLN